MESVALFVVNLIVLAIFGAVFFSRGEVERDLYHKQRITTDGLASKMDKVIEKIREHDKAIIDLSSKLEELEKSIENTPKNRAEKTPHAPLENFTKVGSITIPTESKATPPSANKAAG